MTKSLARHLEDAFVDFGIDLNFRHFCLNLALHRIVLGDGVRHRHAIDRFKVAKVGIDFEVITTGRASPIWT